MYIDEFEHLLNLGFDKDRKLKEDLLSNELYTHGKRYDDSTYYKLPVVLNSIDVTFSQIASVIRIPFQSPSRVIERSDKPKELKERLMGNNSYAKDALRYLSLQTLFDTDNTEEDRNKALLRWKKMFYTSINGEDTLNFIRTLNSALVLKTLFISLVFSGVDIENQNSDYVLSLDNLNERDLEIKLEEKYHTQSNGDIGSNLKISFTAGSDEFSNKITWEHSPIPNEFLKEEYVVLFFNKILDKVLKLSETDDIDILQEKVSSTCSKLTKNINHFNKLSRVVRTDSTSKDIVEYKKAKEKLISVEKRYGSRTIYSYDDDFLYIRKEKLIEDFFKNSNLNQFVKLNTDYLERSGEIDFDFYERFSVLEKSIYKVIIVLLGFLITDIEEMISLVKLGLEKEEISYSIED